MNELTPAITLDPSVRQHLVEGLDSGQRYYFAVVGFNNTNEFNPEVIPTDWNITAFHIYPGDSIQAAIDNAVEGDIIIVHEMYRRFI